MQSAKTFVPPSAEANWPIKRGLWLLLQAYDYAHELGCDAWDFAVEISNLLASGMTHSDLRWLVRKGCVTHGHETTLAGQQGRSFQCGGDLTFSDRSSFVLTLAGTVFARKVLSEREPLPPIEPDPPSGETAPWPTAARPQWDAARQQLRLSGTLMKEFRRPSPNQEAILAAFEEEGWPPRIDDPLPPEPHIDPKRRLQDTIKSLNRSQKRQIVRFMGDGSGQGVRWELVREDGEGSRG